MNTVKRKYTIGMVLSLAFLVTGCSDSGVADLREFVAEAKLKQGTVEPLPRFEPVRSFTYAAYNQKDPFGTGSPAGDSTLAQSRDSGLRPDMNRSREVLESFPLDTLRMMGTLDFQGERWGMVRAPDGIVYRVRHGNHMGQNYGMIREINDNKLMLTEIVPDGLGGWEERSASLGISQQ